MEFTSEERAEVGGRSVMLGVVGPDVRKEYDGSFLAMFSKIWSSVVNRMV